MFRVFLAHSDSAERAAIRADDAWKSPDFSLIGEMSDGETALPIIRDLKPDVLITDYRMLFMNGLELAREAKRFFPWIQVIILSGANDAAACREKLGTDVDEHLIKPVGRYDLAEALRRRGEKITRTRASLEDRIRREEAAVSDDRRESERRLAKWMDTGVRPEKVWQLGRRLCRVLRLSPCDAPVELVKGLVRALEARKREENDLFALDLYGVPTIVVTADDELELEDRAYETAYFVVCAIEHFSNCRVRVGIGQAAGTLDELRASWLELGRMDSVDSQHLQIFAADDLKFYRGRAHREISALAERMMCMEADEAVQALQWYCELGILRSDIVANAVEQMHAECGFPEAVPLPGNNIRCMTRALTDAIARRSENAAEISALPINRARHYAGQSFTKPGPLRYAAAKLAGMSVNRFSVVFHQEMETTFTEYIYRMRVNVAQQLLATRMRISRIAEATGFADVAHFTDVFIHHTGMDPREYRRIHQE